MARRHKKAITAKKLKARYDKEHKGEETITVPHPTLKGTYIQKRV